MALPLLLFALFAGQEAVSTVAPDAPAPVTQAEYTPEGAPRDDYNFTAWCHGVLSGHMALAEHVQSVLPLDEVQQKIGKAYLKGYEEALTVGRKGRSPAELDAADAIRAAARSNWNTAMKAEMQLAADTYLAWQLPGRCEHAAKRVAGRDDLFRLAPSVEDIETLGGVRDSGVAQAPTAPVVTPAAASADSGPLEDAPAEAPVMEAVAAAPPEPEAVPESAPAEVQVAEAPPEPAPAAEEPAPAPAAATTTNDGRIVTMPRKGRLFPWGKRE